MQAVSGNAPVVRSALIALLASCYAPSAPTGRPCSDDLACPRGQVCRPDTLTCERGAGGGEVDAGIDGDATCFGRDLVRVCLLQPPTAVRRIADVAIDTDDDASCEASDQPAWCAIAAAQLAIDGEVRATGARPLVLIGADSISVAGALDVASRAGELGAGANPDACPVQLVPRIRSGGAGGSFGGLGGAGGRGDGGGSTAAPAVQLPTTLRGGCAGGARGGAGGGAVALISNGTIGVAGSINASGAGAPLAGAGTAGGGGGAGGMIALDAPQLLSAGALFANGGGGSEGGGTLVSGAAGEDPADALVPAAGGAGGGNGGDGGDGSADTTLAGGAAAIGQSAASGGGGGGGAGVIRVYGTDLLYGPTSPPVTR